MPNTNCLAGWKCPKCGYEDSFTVAMTCVATLADDGIENEGNFEWEDDAYAACDQCSFAATAGDFQTDGPECQRCGGDGSEPGAPDDDECGTPLCMDCNGSGTNG